MSKLTFNGFLISKMNIIFILSLIIMSSCGLPYCKKVPFSETDLTWLDPYSVGDTILFVCEETNSVDTMVITDLDICNPPNTSIFDLRGCNWMEDDNEFNGIANCTFDILHRGEVFDGIFSISKECSQKPAFFDIIIWGWYPSDDISIGNTIKKSKNGLLKDTETLVIKGPLLHRKIHYVLPPVSKLYWNREKGLTEYQIGSATYRLKK